MRDADIALLQLQEKHDLIHSSLCCLDAEKFYEFKALLDAQPSHNPGLERLMSVKAPWGADEA